MVDNLCTSLQAEKLCKVTTFMSFKNYENNSTVVKVITKNTVAPYCRGHDVFSNMVVIHHLDFTFLNFDHP